MITQTDITLYILGGALYITRLGYLNTRISDFETTYAFLFWPFWIITSTAYSIGQLLPKKKFR